MELIMENEWSSLGDEKGALKGLLTVLKLLREEDATMTIQQALILVWVSVNEGSTQNELMKALGLPQSTVSRVTAALSDIGTGRGKRGLDLVKWTTNPLDRRTNLLVLTTKGHLFMKDLASRL